MTNRTEHTRAGEWIPVSERLPEPGVSVMVAWDSGTFKGWVRQGMYLGDPDKPWSMFTPTHWMPLPDPPGLGVLSEAKQTEPAQPRIYAASRASVPERPAMWKRFRSNGVKIVSSWIDEAEPGATADLGELWQRIVSEIASADRLVLYVEPGDFPLKGALIEVGVALGMGKPVFVVASDCKFDPPSYRPIGSWIKHHSVKVSHNFKDAFASDVVREPGEDSKQ